MHLFYSHSVSHFKPEKTPRPAASGAQIGAETLLSRIAGSGSKPKYCLISPIMVMLRSLPVSLSGFNNPPQSALR